MYTSILLVFEDSQIQHNFCPQGVHSLVSKTCRSGIILNFKFYQGILSEAFVNTQNLEHRESPATAAAAAAESLQSCLTLCDPRDGSAAAHQSPPSLGFSRQEHWSGLPFPSPMHESEK